MPFLLVPEMLLFSLNTWQFFLRSREEEGESMGVAVFSEASQLWRLTRNCRLTTKGKIEWGLVQPHSKFRILSESNRSTAEWGCTSIISALATCIHSKACYVERSKQVTLHYKKTAIKAIAEKNSIPHKFSQITGASIIAIQRLFPFSKVSFCAVLLHESNSHSGLGPSLIKQFILAVS